MVCCGSLLVDAVALLLKRQDRKSKETYQCCGTVGKHRNAPLSSSKLSSRGVDKEVVAEAEVGRISRELMGPSSGEQGGVGSGEKSIFFVEV